MAVNSSRLPVSWCSILSTHSSLVYYQVTLTTCVVNLILAPVAVAGNATIMAAIWRNRSLRTPSYVLLAGLAFTDFCTGLLSQPFFVMYQVAQFTGNRKLFCIAGFITEIVGYYFSSLTGMVMTIMAVERWLHMSRRSLLTLRRVVIIYIIFVVLLIAFYTCRMYYWYYTKNYYGVFMLFLLLGAAFCFLVTVFAYFKVFRIIREHQSQVQTNQNAIDIQKYKKSIFTILYILALFFVSYVPIVCCFFVVSIMDKSEADLAVAAQNVCGAIVFSSSFFNPLLYYWRIKEIRDSVSPLVRKFFCKENGEQS